jgi:predicted flap endonuclease-1-like 5' DNA nuclease
VKAPADEADVEDAEGEAAGNDEDAVAAGTDASASTGSMVDDDVDDPDEAAEPAEAVGIDDAEEEATVDTEPPETDDAAAAGSDAAASTGSMVDENVGGPDEAAEAAEAVDVDTGDEAAAADDADAADETGDESDTEPTESPSPDVLKGIGPAYAERLADAGIDTVAALAAADADAVADDIDVSAKRVSRWIERAKEY